MHGNAAPAALLVHDGELADVAELLGDLGVAFGERRGTPTAQDTAARWDLVIATPKRMLEFAADPHCARIAVLEADSKTLRAMLQRAGTDLIVRRPVHPAALRLLVIHTFYRGPEKRHAERVAVGHPVRYRTGRLRRLPAAMVDLSMSGCRLIADRRVPIGASIALHLPPELAGRRPFVLNGTVVRAGPAQGGRPGRTSLAVAFGDPDAAEEARLHAAVRAHVAGPAMVSKRWLGETLGTPPGSDRHREGDAPDAPERAAADPVDAGEEEIEPTAAPGDRRAHQRRTISRPVVAMGQQATRVLLGRDISLGGMRVDAHPTLSVGEEIRIAIHVRVHDPPIVLRARVDRDDGDRGLLLRFDELADEERAGLEQLVGFLPVLLAGESPEQDEGLVVSEIVEGEGA